MTVSTHTQTIDCANEETEKKQTKQRERERRDSLAPLRPARRRRPTRNLALPTKQARHDRLLLLRLPPAAALTVPAVRDRHVELEHRLPRRRPVQRRRRGCGQRGGKRGGVDDGHGHRGGRGRGERGAGARGGVGRDGCRGADGGGGLSWTAARPLRQGVVSNSSSSRSSSSTRG